MKKASVYFGYFLSSPVPLPTYANVTHDAMYLKRQDGSSMRRAMQPDAVSMLQRVMRLCVVADSEKLQIDAAQHAAFPVPSCAIPPRLLRIDTPMPEQLSYTCVDNDRWQRRGRSKRVSPTLLQSSSSRPRDRSRRLRHRCCGHSGTDSGPNSPEDWPARDGAGYPFKHLSTKPTRRPPPKITRRDRAALPSTSWRRRTSTPWYPRDNCSVARGTP